MPPSFPPPALPLPPPPLERLQGRGAAPEAPHQAFGPRGPPPYPPPLPPPPHPPLTGPPPCGPARSNLGDPGPPRRRLVYPGGGDGGGELPQYDNGPAGEPEGRGRRAPGGAWGQLSEGARDELMWPLRVESGRTDEPRTIERPRGRARVLDRRELAPLPGEGRRGAPRPPPSPEELGMGSPEAESTGAGREGETAVGPRPKKARRGSRAPRPSHDHRDANRRKDREEIGGPPERGQGDRAEGP